MLKLEDINLILEALDFLEYKPIMTLTQETIASIGLESKETILKRLNEDIAYRKKELTILKAKIYELQNIMLDKKGDFTVEDILKSNP